MDSYSLSDSSAELLRDPRLPRPVPRVVHIVYILVMILHSFVFYALWWQIVPFVRDYYIHQDRASTDPVILPTMTAQIFLLINYMTPIFGGVVTDLRHTRYHVIFVSKLILTLAIAVTIVLTYFFDSIPTQYGFRGGLVGVMLFIIASSSGVSKTSLMIFGIEQLDDDRDALKRQSYRRLVFWFYELGRILALLLLQFEKDTSLKLPNRRLISGVIIFAASAIIIPLFLVCKRLYRFNKPNGLETFKNFAKALDIINSDEDTFWDFGGERQPQQDPDHLHHFQRSILRRYGLLTIIFFTFGAFYTGDYFAGIIYPFQDGRNTNQTVSMGTKTYNTADYLYQYSVPLLLGIPILEIIIRKFRLYGNLTNFYFLGFGMLLSMISISISRFEYHAATAVAKSMLSGFSQFFFYPPGFDLCDIEAPRSLRGTSTGLFLGLGTFFGGLVYIIWLCCPPAGVTEDKWWYARVIVGSIMACTLLAYTAASYLYCKSKKETERARSSVDARYLVDSINHYSRSGEER